MIDEVPENLILLAFYLNDALAACGIEALDYADKINLAQALHRAGVEAPR